MKLSDMLSREHGLNLAKNNIANFIWKIIIAILVAGIWVAVLASNNILGFIFLFYIISFLFRSKVDDFNHLITFILIIVGMVYKYSSHPFQLTPLYFSVFIIFLLWPTIFGILFHDREIMKLWKAGGRKDIKNNSNPNSTIEIDVNGVMKSELPHSFIVYVIPSLIFIFIFPIIKVDDVNLDIAVFSNITFFIIGYELARYFGTIELKAQNTKKGS